MNKRILDEKDIKILNIIQTKARTQNVDIARKLRMAPSAILERIRKLEEGGVIQGYETRVNADSVGMGLTAFLFITTGEPVGETGIAARIAEFPEVQEVHAIAGEDCYIVKLRAANPKELMKLLRNRFKALKAIRSIRTTIVLDTFKETIKLPLPAITKMRRK